MPENATKAVIWDMDGVIADTALYHMQAWQKALRKKGVDFTEEDFQKYFGQRNEEIIGKVLGEEITKDEMDEIAIEKEESFRSLVRPNVRLLPGVIDLMKVLSKNDFIMALASSTPMKNIQLLTQSLGIDRCFQSIISAEDVTEGKPNPQVFLLAAESLAIEPGNCIVIEDAVAGITAAKKAGMLCLAVTNTHPRERLVEADLVVDTLEAVTIESLIGLLNNRLKKENRVYREVVVRKRSLDMERSLVLIKPDAMQRNLAGVIIGRLEEHGLKVVALKMLHVDKALAERHYAIHIGKPFFEDLIKYITSTPIVAVVFEGEGAVEEIRKIMGVTDPAKADAGTIRADFGTDIQKNVVHGSDSIETAKKEIDLFFTPEEIYTY